MLAVDPARFPTFATPPMRRSPLGIRDPNSCPWSVPLFPMSNKGVPSKNRNIEPRKREGKFAPLLRKKDDRDLRRNAYLARGKAASDEKRFEARAEQSLRLEWMEEQRQWQAQKEAEDVSHIEADPDLEVPTSAEEEPPSDIPMDESEAMIGEYDEDAIQYYLLSQQKQNQDMELPDLGQAQPLRSARDQSTEFWSDDDDFEQSLLEAAMQIERAPDWNPLAADHAADENMDVSMG